MSGLSHLGTQLNLNYYISLASFIVLYYDFLLTLGAEVEHFWGSGHRIRWPSLLFFFSRYLALFGHTPLLFAFFAESLSDKVRIQCAALGKYDQYYTTVLQLIIAALCIIRVSALYSQGHRRVVILSLLLIVLVWLGIAFAFFVFVQKNFHIRRLRGVRGCNPEYSHSEGLWIAFAWLGVLTLDISVFALTLRKTLGVGMENPSSLFRVLLHDGALYFSVLFVINLSNILAYLFAPPLLKSVVGMPTNVLSSTLMSRLMLNLRIQYGVHVHEGVHT
ncbi:hypothetical protein BC834DRAFT_907618 [Gloeopeniophorella convolvens]|nr:hypothetical protein BC834DRAFT_907618 [Gloeopeniophorella convolvens]